MREFKYIDIHHSATPIISLDDAVKSFNYTHKKRFHDYYVELNKETESQNYIPMKESMGLYIAYHFLIDYEGNDRQTREIFDIGYSAGNWEVNKHGISICLIGNFDEIETSKAQLETLEYKIELIQYMLSATNPLLIGGHRLWSPYKSCPGKNITDEYLKSLNSITPDYMEKGNPAGVKIESGWLDKSQEQCVRLLTIIAEEDFALLYDDNAIQNPQNYDKAKRIFEGFMRDFSAPECPEEKKNSPFWTSMWSLAQCLPLYKKIREGNKNHTHLHVCRWFREVVEQEFEEIIIGKQKFIPENKEK